MGVLNLKEINSKFKDLKFKIEVPKIFESLNA